MFNNELRKYKDIILEAHLRHGGKISKFEASYTDLAQGQDQCRVCKNYIHPNQCHIVEGFISPGGWCKHFEHAHLDEKWGTSTAVSPSERGKYHGKTRAELLHAYHTLKQSGPHHEGSPEYERMKELAFAIRAKGGWGKVSEKMATKDYDHDGKIETEKDEVWGSRFRAAKKSGRM